MADMRDWLRLITEGFGYSMAMRSHGVAAYVCTL